ncbi:MAG: hypothetical protein GEV09_16440 [Pseudonocardiaceae bacterium]|nr:hypothetical protein [Pseudonocardiaceae bacterium]
MIGGRVLDADALTGFATGRPVYVRALVWAAVEENVVLAVPSSALTRVWAELDPVDHPALDVLLDLPITVIEELDRPAAREVGTLLAGFDPAEVDLGQVLRCARRRGWPVVTTRSGTLRKLDHAVQVEEMP